MIRKLGYEVISCTNLCTDGVNSYGAIQLLFGQPTLNRSCKPLGDFSSIWTKDMETNDPLLKTKGNQIQGQSCLLVSFDNMQDFLTQSI